MKMRGDNNNSIQQVYFDKAKNQYQSNLIINPPLHTQKEINFIFDRIKKSNLKNNDEIIDFGAGSGRLTIPLLKKGYQVMAVDISDESLKYLKMTANNLFLSKLKTVKFLPSEKQRYWVIVGSDILHHINLDEQIPQLYKILKKGGKVIFSEPGAFNPSWYIFLTLFSNWKVEKGIVNCTAKNLEKIFKKYRFSNVKTWGFGLFPRPFFNFSEKIGDLNDNLGDVPLIKQFAYRYIIEAIK